MYLKHIIAAYLHNFGRSDIKSCPRIPENIPVLQLWNSQHSVLSRPIQFSIPYSNDLSSTKVETPQVKVLFSSWLWRIQCRNNAFQVWILETLIRRLMIFFEWLLSKFFFFWIVPIFTQNVVVPQLYIYMYKDNILKNVKDLAMAWKYVMRVYRK